DYVLKCSHLFNVLDTRGAVSVIERADYFRRMQRLAAQVARDFADQRARLGYPNLPADWEVNPESGMVSVPAIEPPQIDPGPYPTKPAPFLLEIGTEELPAGDLDSAIAQLCESVPAMLADARLTYESFTIGSTPRRLVVMVES